MKRYAEKYARSFVSQGFGPEDRVLFCASYGMNVGAKYHDPCSPASGDDHHPVWQMRLFITVISKLSPDGDRWSVFKLLRLYRRLEHEGIKPKESSVIRLVAGGESFCRRIPRIPC